jgi:hypothetical protein
MSTDFIKKELKKYNITDAEISKVSKECMQLIVTSVDDMTNYNIVKQARIGIKAKRVEVEKKRKELKSESLAFGKAVDGEAKRIFALIAPIEEYLISQEDIVDDEKQRIKDVNARLEQEQKDKEEVECQQEIADEEVRLEEQRIEQEKKEKELQEKQDKIDVENLKIENDKAKIQIEQQRQEDIEKAQERATAEAEEKARQDADEKLEMEKQEKKDEELRIAQLPDRERIHLYAEALKAIVSPALSNAKMQEKFKVGKVQVVGAYKYFKSI